MISDCYRKGGGRFCNQSGLKRFEAAPSCSNAPRHLPVRLVIPSQERISCSEMRASRFESTRRVNFLLLFPVSLFLYMSFNLIEKISIANPSNPFLRIKKMNQNASVGHHWNYEVILNLAWLDFRCCFFFSSFRTASPAIDGSRRNFFLNLDFWRKRKEQKENYRLSLDYHQINYHKTEW